MERVALEPLSHPWAALPNVMISVCSIGRALDIDSVEMFLVNWQNN